MSRGVGYGRVAVRTRTKARSRIGQERCWNETGGGARTRGLIQIGLEMGHEAVVPGRVLANRLAAFDCLLVTGGG